MLDDNDLARSATLAAAMAAGDDELKRMGRTLTEHVAALADARSWATERLLDKNFADPACVAVDVRWCANGRAITVEGVPVTSRDAPFAFDDCVRYLHPARG